MCVVFATAVMVIGTAHARTMRVREAGLWRPTRSTAGKVMGGIPSIRPGASAAIQAVTALKDRLGISADADTLRVRLSDTDRFGRMHVRLQQFYKGLEVDGRELIVHFGADGEVYEVNGDYLEGISLGTTPSVAVTGATLVVYCAGDSAAAARLAWKLRERKSDTFVDAQTGEVIHVRRRAPHAQTTEIQSDDLPYDGDAVIQTASQMPFPEGTATTVTGALPAQQGGAVVSVGATLGTDGKTYLATRNEAGVEISVLDGMAAPQFRKAAQLAFILDNETWFEEFHENATFAVYSEDPANDPANALAIVYNIATVLDYYAAAFNRSSYDGRGGRVAAWRFWNEDINDFDSGFENAFWMSMNDGGARTNGCFFFGYDLTGVRSETSLDTCGHELTHGITSWSADLLYEAEPGALNESFSDIIGVACEFAAQPRAADPATPRPAEADWLFDEDSGKASRSLANPKLFGQPSSYKGLNWVNTSDVSEDNDNGGVHGNSGVQNFFFYLLSEGGYGVNDGIEYDLRGIGVEKAVQIAYLALTAYCGPRTDYASVAGCWDSAALDLVESGVLTAEDHAALAPAWAAVMGPMTTFDGVGEVVYANAHIDKATSLLLKVGKANRMGVARATATLTVDGVTMKFTGKASTATGVASLKNRRLGKLELLLGVNGATGTLEWEDGRTIPVGAVRVSPRVSHVSGLDALRVGIAASGDVALDGGALNVRYSAKKLPAGMKINAKTGEISGWPRRAGSGTAIISARCTFAVEGEKNPVSAMVARQAAWKVDAMDEFAQGKFIGDNMAISISKVGRLSGSVTVGDKRLRLSARSYKSFVDGVYASSGTVRGGTFVVEVDAVGLRGVLTTATGTTPFTATRAVRLQ